MFFFWIFTFVADFLTSIVSVLLPIYASYKALQSRDASMQAKWLTYWTTLSLCLAVENQLYFILSWVPFYPWLRLGLHLYLIAPGFEGAVKIYWEYINPFLEGHERELDRLVSGVWERLWGLVGFTSGGRKAQEQREGAAEGVAGSLWRVVAGYAGNAAAGPGAKEGAEKRDDGYSRRESYEKRDSYDRRESYGRRDSYERRDGYERREDYDRRERREASDGREGRRDESKPDGWEGQFDSVVDQLWRTGADYLRKRA